jgi:hypothetical protein
VSVTPLLLLCGLATGLAACSGRSAFAPDVDAGCTADQQNTVALDDSLRVTNLFVTREYSVADIRNNDGSVHTQNYRVCQSFVCRVVRPEPAAPLTDAETVDALAACRVEADKAWAYLRTL